MNHAGYPRLLLMNKLQLNELKYLTGFVLSFFIGLPGALIIIITILPDPSVEKTAAFYATGLTVGGVIVLVSMLILRWSYNGHNGNRTG